MLLQSCTVAEHAAPARDQSPIELRSTQASSNQSRGSSTAHRHRPGLKRNEFQAGKAVAEANKIVQPLPLTAEERDTAIASIDRHLTEDTEALKAKLKNVLPDELAVLAKTTNWTADQQNALVVALRASDPAAAFAAWTQGSPRDTAGAEIVARQTEAGGSLRDSNRMFTTRRRSCRI